MTPCLVYSVSGSTEPFLSIFASLFLWTSAFPQKHSMTKTTPPDFCLASQLWMLQSCRPSKKSIVWVLPERPGFERLLPGQNRLRKEGEVRLCCSNSVRCTLVNEGCIWLSHSLLRAHTVGSKLSEACSFNRTAQSSSSTFQSSSPCLTNGGVDALTSRLSRNYRSLTTTNRQNGRGKAVRMIA